VFHSRPALLIELGRLESTSAGAATSAPLDYTLFTSDPTVPPPHSTLITGSTTRHYCYATAVLLKEIHSKSLLFEELTIKTHRNDDRTAAFMIVGCI
jgi:hypothetical protein